ncbi:hypothetical protein WJX74_008495 [Apatococcus lobatus]|uniref:Uncharacterized protein n=1 Tax=Apatococcus lobatus TaxID=904363 RepID=A0AAW1Q583_9CHLO
MGEAQLETPVARFLLTFAAGVGACILVQRLLIAEQRRSSAKPRVDAFLPESGPRSTRSNRAASAPLRSTLRKSIEEDSQRPLHVRLQEDSGKGQHVHVLLQQEDGSWYPNPDSDHEEPAQGTLLQRGSDHGVRSFYQLLLHQCGLQRAPPSSLPLLPSLQHAS